jgi:hypothetical protein
MQTIEILIRKSINIDELNIEANDFKKSFSEMYRIDKIIFLIKQYKV